MNTAELDILESGFCVSVHFGSGKRASSHLDIYSGGGEWRHGVVMRSYISPDPKMAQYDGGVCYDIMVDGKEEKGVAHGRCRMVCNVCLSDKRTFRPPPMFCEKCFTAIHQRWSYWEEGGDEGGLKLCKRCYSDIRASSQPNKLLCDLAHRPNMQIEAFIEKKEKDRPEYVDNWVQCDECHSWMHWTCGLYKGEDTPDDCLFFCDTCRLTRGRELADDLDGAARGGPRRWTSLDAAAGGAAGRPRRARRHVLAGDGARRVNIETVTKFDQQPGMPGYQPPAAPTEKKEKVEGIKEFPYRPGASRLPARRGHEVCFFAMYLQEYGSDCPQPNTNRVYVSYLDSVRYFRSSPEGQRTTVYHSLLIEYLRYVREQGFTHAHIWVSPPKQGDDYIFYAHPEAMVNKRMGLLKLKEWYEKMLDESKKRGIVVDFQDMQEEYKDIESIDDIPMFSGDHWAASIVKKQYDLKKAVEEKAAAKVALEKAAAAAAEAGKKKKGSSHRKAEPLPPPVDEAAAAEDDGDRGACRRRGAGWARTAAPAAAAPAAAAAAPGRRRARPTASCSTRSRRR